MKIRLMILVLAVAFFNACSTTTVRKLSGTQMVPGAVGFVELDRTANNNVQVDLKVRHLAQPSQIASNAATYVVWAEPTVGERDQIQNMGALKVNEDLEGQLKTILPHTNFRLFVTAEPSTMVSRPSNDTVLEGNLYRIAE